MTLVNADTGEIVAEMTPDDARLLTDRISTAVSVAWELVTTAYTGRAWAALGYESWDRYCSAEFGASRLALPREDRREAVASLREAGLSIRAIAAATGADAKTVQSDLRATVGTSHTTPTTSASPASAPPTPADAGDVEPPAPIVGINGKNYARPTAPDPLTDEQQYEADLIAADKRNAKRIEAIVERWGVIRTLPSNPRREHVLSHLLPNDLRLLAEIEKELGR